MERVNEKDKDYRFGDSGVKYIFRGPNVDWGIILFKPGQSLGLHYHQRTEETFYFLEEGLKVIVDDKEFQAEAGDAFRFSPNEKHNIINETEKNIKVIFIKYPYLPEDKVDVKQ